MDLAALNALDAGAAARAFLRCCGSARWARLMAEARPFASADGMAGGADAIWQSLDPSDWLEAFAAHPQIGEGTSARCDADPTDRAARPGPPTWSDQEQAAVAGTPGQTRRRLAQANRDYQARFGYIFIVCATGKTGDEMLAMLEMRMRHDRAEELATAAEEQRKITQLRLIKLLEQESDTP